MPTFDPEGAEMRAIDRLVDLSDKSIVEVGAGDGRLTWRLASRAKSVLAIEPNERYLALARDALTPDLHGRVRFEPSDATTYRFPQEGFDVAVLSWSL